MGAATVDRETQALMDFNRHEHRIDGEQITRSLCSGLILLRDLFYGRMHFDVEQMVGTDSMLIPVSELKTQKAAKDSIDAFQLVEAVRAMQDFGYVKTEDDWPVEWLGQLRLGEAYRSPDIAAQIDHYWSLAGRARQLALTDVLLRVLPESRRAPLVLFRLVPLAVRIVTAVAFSDHASARDVRRQQASVLPPVVDCHQCRGTVLDNGDLCDMCGNPLWRFEWLNATD